MGKWIVGLLTPLIVFSAAWWIVSPGIFTIQPIGAIPEGGTIIYHSRGPNMPFFASPDGLCLKIQGSVSLLCRATALAGAAPLTERILIRLPYSRMAYLASTGGVEFEQHPSKETR